MSVRAARRLTTTTFLISVRLGLAGLFIIGASNALQTAIAEGDTRTLSFHHLHTNEDITITFKRNGRYDEAALKKLNWFMRDWRKDQDVRMDPHLFDLLWEAYREVGATQPIQVICGYRSPATNAMLRARSSGVAEVSQHSAGNAMDFFIPGVPLAKIREVGLRMQRGGVGFYPTSGSPFVHMDTGTVRHWPRMTYAQLEKVFPDGRTVHVASDGRPLPGYALALADVERRGSTPNHVSLEAARAAGAITAQQEAEATSVAAANKQQPSRSLFAGLFGFGKKDTEETSDKAAASTTAAKSTRARTVVASAAPPKPVATERIVPLPASRPQVPVAVASAEPKQATYQTASASFDSRGVWPATVNQTAKNASPFTDTAATGTAPPLAYAAADSEPAPMPRTRPMGRNVPQIAKESNLVPVQTAAAAMPPAPLLIAGAQNPDSPWLRAAMLTPSVSAVMRATQIGTFDPRPMQHLLHKPADALTMSFSADPSLGMFADRFSGPAVVFVATTTFASAKTAALR
ncbi:DUF882 domain-containing protein [Microbacteriaceae bacterium K1510]|nr:DUF882 domain-containing protein [Microbacteriaceae bacterium K1510]